jgi:hypothetical protein
MRAQFTLRWNLAQLAGVVAYILWFLLNRFIELVVPFIRQYIQGHLSQDVYLFYIMIEPRWVAVGGYHF